MSSIPGKYEPLEWHHLVSTEAYRKMLARIDGVCLYVVCRWGDEVVRLHYEIQKGDVIVSEQSLPGAALKAFNAARGLS